MPSEETKNKMSLCESLRTALLIKTKKGIFALKETGIKSFQ